MKDENLIELEMFYIFFITCIMSLASIEAEKIFCGQGIEMSFSFTFALISIIYNLFSMAKPHFKKGLNNYDAHIFIFTFTISFIFMFTMLVKFEYIIDFKINYDNIFGIVNNRIQRLMAYEDNFPISLFLIDKIHLKFLFSLCFSFHLSGMYFVCTRIAYFDVLLQQTEEKLKRIYMISDNNSVVKTYKNYNKIRLIYQFFIFYLLVDPLFKNFLTEELKIINEVTYYTFLFGNIIMETFLMIKTSRIDFKLFFEQNCVDMMEFAENPQRSNLDGLKNKMHLMNNKGFEIFPQFFYISFLPILMFMLFYNRSCCSEEIHNVFFNITNLNFTLNSTVGESNFNISEQLSVKNLNNFKFKNSLVETICYFFLIANYFGKSFITLAYSYYLSNFSRHTKIYLI